MVVETPRLLLRPLTFLQLLKYAQNDASLETELGLEPIDRIISNELKEALLETILPNALDTTKRLPFCTLWTIILKARNCMVGDLCFVDEPDQWGRAELGYGLYPQFEGNGYMTEAVGALSQWALQQPGVSLVVASTEKHNIGSLRVLEKNHFQRYEETEDHFYWRLAPDCSLSNPQ